MKTSDGSFTNSKGQLVFVSIDRFVNDITAVTAGDKCFLCAEPIVEGCVTKEHIIPNWILRKCNLHDRLITLPNGARFKYGEYVLPCCNDCNGLLDRELEKPIKRAFENGFSSLQSFLNSGGKPTLFIWLSLLFIKTHLKDQTFRMFLDHRKTNESIAEGGEYQWEIFHHTYCISRIPFTKVKFDNYALGSLLVVKLNTNDVDGQFDFIDLTNTYTLGLVIGDIGVIAVFGDAGSVRVGIQELIIDRIEAPLSSAQFRELVAHFSCCSMHMKNHPTFMTIVDSDDHNEVEIVTTLPDCEPEFHPSEPRVLGALMDQLLGKYVEIDLREDLAKGELSFLFDSNGDFIRDSFRPE